MMNDVWMDNDFDQAISHTKKMLKIAPEKDNLILEIGKMYKDYLNDMVNLFANWYLDYYKKQISQLKFQNVR